MAEASLKRAGQFIKNVVHPNTEAVNSTIINLEESAPSRAFVKVYYNGVIKPIVPMHIIETGHLELEKSQYAKQGLSNGLNGISGRGLGSKLGNHGLALFRAL